MNGVIVFDYTAFVLGYPELASVSPQQAQVMFDRACLLIDNTPCSPICDLSIRSTVLNLATAHFVFIFATLNGQPPRSLAPPGRLSSASEGSVSTSFEYITAASNTEAFWNQTEYGAAAWAALLPYRTGRYYTDPYSTTVGVVPYPGAPFLAVPR